MDKFVGSLRKKYRERLLHREKQWPPVSGERLVNLQLVEAEKKEGFRAGLPQHGAGDDKVKRTPVLHGDLFKADKGKKPVRKAIVEGNAGIGKTTLCTMLTEEWAEGKILTQFDCVLLLPLREKSAASATTLPHLFKLLHSSERIRASAIEEMEEKEGEGILIIADGWDELDDTNRSEDSFLYNLLFGDALPFASVLLTSRPSASAPLHNLPSVDRLIEVVGFNEENIKQYIETEYESCPDKASSLLNQLDDNPLIGSVCSVPLNCAIVCNLWHTLDQVLPTTLTELYTQIVLNVILRNLRKESAVGLSLKNFDSIPEDLQDEFWKTCEFAYECLSRDEIVFSESELASLFPDILSSSNKFLCFGLLQSARSLLPVGEGLSFHFAHLSFQEFLAALHLVTLSTEDKLTVFKAHAKSVRFDNVWRFVFGLGCKKQNLCSKKVVCLDDLLVDQFLSSFRSESLSETEVVLLLSHCAFESMDHAVSTKVARHLNGYLNKRNIAQTPHDCVAVFHVLRHSFGHCPQVDVPLDGCSLTDKQLKELTNILSSANGKLQVRRLDLSNNKLTNAGVNDLFERASASFSVLEQLRLSDNPLGVSGIQSLETAVQAGVLVNLEWLSLSNTLTDDADINGALLTTLLPSITSHCPRLRGLNLNRNNLGVPGACALRHVFAHFTSRDRFFLDLSDTKLNSEAVIILSKCVYAADVSVNYGSILSICNNPLGYDGLLALFRMLRCQACSIRSLFLNNTDCSTPTQSRSHNIPPTNLLSTKALNLGPPLENSKLTDVNVSLNNFSGERVIVLAECFRVCKSLKYLWCIDSCLTSLDINSLISHLESSGYGHSNLEGWYLSSNSIDDHGVNNLIECVPELFPRLTDIDLRGNPVSDETKKRLNTCLQANKGRWKTEDRDMDKALIARDEALTEWKFAGIPPWSEEANVQEWMIPIEDVTILRSAAIAERERTQSPPQSEELLSVFLMWDELCWILSYMVYTRSRYPHLYGLPSELSRPATPSDDESFHSATEELDEPVGPITTNKSTCPTVQPPHRMDQPCEASAVGVSSPQSPPDVTTPPMTTPSSHGTQSGSVMEATTDTLTSLHTPSPTHPTTHSATPELTLRILNEELKTLTKPIQFGICLGLPQHRLEVIQQDNRHDTDGQKIALFQYIAKNHKSLVITWTHIADALLDIHAGNLSLSIRTKYCSTGHESQVKEH